MANGSGGNRTLLSTGEDTSREDAIARLLNPLRAPVTAAQGAAEARPLLAAIDAAAAARRPTIRTNVLARNAEAGFGLSGRTDTQTETALAADAANTEYQRQSAIRQAMADIAGRNQATISSTLDEERLRADKEANKRRKFLGIF